MIVLTGLTGYAAPDVPPAVREVVPEVRGESAVLHPIPEVAEALHHARTSEAYRHKSQKAAKRHEGAFAPSLRFIDSLGLTFTLAIAAGIAIWFGLVVLIGKALHRHAAPRTRYLPPQPDLWDDWDFTVERRKRDAEERQAALEMRKAS